MRKLLLLFLSGIICLIYFGCQKDSKAFLDTDQQFIEEAKSFFNQTINANSTVQTSGSDNEQGSARKSAKKTPIWENGYTKNISIGEAVLLPLHFDSKISARSNMSGQIIRQIEDISKLLMYKDAHGKFKIEVVNYYSDSNYLKGRSKKFTGIITVEDWEGNYIKGFRYAKDRVFRLKPPTENSSTPSNVKTNYVQAPGKTCYWEDLIRCFIDGSGNSYNCVTLHSDFLGCDDDDDGSGYTPGGPSGNDYQEVHTPHIVIASNVITNNTTNPCIHSAVETALSNFTTIINDLKSDFQLPGNFIITFTDVTNLPSLLDGGTTFHTETDGIHIDIKLNQNTLPVASLEYITKIILHESMHAILIGSGVAWDDLIQHTAIATYIGDLIDGIQEITPGVSTLDATAMAWSGLDGTDAFKALGNDTTLYRNIMDQYRLSNGTSGTRCP